MWLPKGCFWKVAKIRQCVCGGRSITAFEKIKIHKINVQFASISKIQILQTPVQERKLQNYFQKSFSQKEGKIKLVR